MSETQSESLAPKTDIAVLCLSGGMDSTSLLLHLLAEGTEVYAVSLDYGQKHRIELERLESNLQYLASHGYKVPHHVLDLSGLGSLYHSALTNDDWEVPTGYYAQDNMKQTVVPNRNAIFASIAYGYALSISGRLRKKTKLALGVHSGDHAIYPDCRPEFYQAIMKSFALGNWGSENVELTLPYIDGDKVTILRDAEKNCLALALDFDEVFRNTWTSYQPDELGRADGRTGSDVERILAFDAIGRTDPIEYREEWKDVLAYAKQAELKFQAEQQ